MWRPPTPHPVQSAEAQIVLHATSNDQCSRRRQRGARTPQFSVPTRNGWAWRRQEVVSRVEPCGAMWSHVECHVEPCVQCVLQGTTAALHQVRLARPFVLRLYPCRPMPYCGQDGMSPRSCSTRKGSGNLDRRPGYSRTTSSTMEEPSAHTLE